MSREEENDDKGVEQSSIRARGVVTAKREDDIPKTSMKVVIEKRPEGRGRKNTTRATEKESQ